MLGTQATFGLLVLVITVISGRSVQSDSNNYNPCDGVHEFFPDPLDCSKFYHCDDYRASHKDCPAGLHWDVKTNRCQWPDIAQCGSSVISLTTKTLPLTTQVPKITTERPRPTEELKSTKAPTPTPGTYNPCDGTTEFFPDPLDCSKFYHCDGFRASHKDCPKGLNWDVKSNRCEWPDIAQCGSSVIPQTTKPLPLPTQVPKITTERPHPTKELKSTKAPTPTPGTYNPCDGTTEFFPDPLDCSKFYHCDGFRASHKDCPKGLNWDVKSNRCEWPDIAQCGSSVIPQTTKSLPLPTQVPKITTERPHPTKELKSTKAPTPTPGTYNPCDGTTEFFPDPLDCSKFYHCDGFRASHKDCPKGLNWDVKSNRCEWPDIAQCGISTLNPRPMSTIPPSNPTPTKPSISTSTKKHSPTTKPYTKSTSSTRRPCTPKDHSTTLDAQSTTEHQNPLTASSSKMTPVDTLSTTGMQQSSSTRTTPEFGNPTTTVADQHQTTTASAHKTTAAGENPTTTPVNVDNPTTDSGEHHTSAVSTGKGETSKTTNNGDNPSTTNGGLQTTAITDENTPTTANGELQTTTANDGTQTTIHNGENPTPPTSGGNPTTPTSGENPTTPTSGGNPTTTSHGELQTTRGDGGNPTTTRNSGNPTTTADSEHQTTPTSGGNPTTTADSEHQTTPTSGGTTTTTDGNPKTTSHGELQTTTDDGGNPTTTADGEHQTTPDKGGNPTTTTSPNGGYPTTTNGENPTSTAVSRIPKTTTIGANPTTVDSESPIIPTTTAAGGQSQTANQDSTSTREYPTSEYTKATPEEQSTSTITPSPAPEFDLCSTHLLYADPINCANFYYCVDGKPQLRTCPDGKEWNSLTNRCECHGLCGCKANPV